MTRHLGRAVALLGVAATGIAVVPVTASSAALTCHEQEATIVGSPQVTWLAGTDGPDVIVSNGSRQIDARDGDDLICLTATTGKTYDVSVDAGGGDDVVDASSNARGVDVFATLGSGDDTYLGGPGIAADSVNAQDLGHDLIATGNGRDTVSTGGTGGLDNDVIDLGDAADKVHGLGSLGPDTSIDGGDGSDTLFGPRARTGAWIFDVPGGEARRDGVRAFAMTELERFAPDEKAEWGYGVRLNGSTGSVSFIGGSEPELIRVLTSDFVGAHMGGGADQVGVFTAGLLTGASVEGGPGRDSLTVEPNKVSGRVGHLGVSLEREVVRYTYRTGGTVTGRVSGFRYVEVRAVRLHLTGDPDDNFLSWMGCRVEVAGGPGNDFISGRSRRHGCPGQVRVFGNRGNDDLFGSAKSDHLVGGPGLDRARGRGGRDYCQAERLRDCEIIVP